jgi:glycopeptide antibiotics resistance protein
MCKLPGRKKRLLRLTITKFLSKGLLASYLLMLTWLVLFKLSFHISSILEYHHRSLNLVPFAAPSMINGRINYSEMILNCVFFIPFGLLLNLNFKNTGFLSKLLFVIAFSLTAEILQYIFAIGASDITDVITNTLGGFLGLVLYNLCNKFISTEKLDKIIISAGIILLVLFLSVHFSHFLFRRD